MKATYRAKFNALKAMNDGYSLITIRRRKETVGVWLEDIIDTPNGEKVQEHEVTMYSQKKRSFNDIP